MMPSRLTRPDPRPSPPGDYRPDQIFSPVSDDHSDRAPKRWGVIFGAVMVTLVAALGVVASVPSLRGMLGPSRPFVVTTTVASSGSFPSDTATLPPTVRLQP